MSESTSTTSRVLPAAASVESAGFTTRYREQARRRRRMGLAALLLLAAAAAAFFLLRGGVTKAEDGVWIAPARKAFARHLTELGIVVARNETSVFSPISGEVVWKIEEGTFVEPGTVVVRFDPNQFDSDLDQMRQDIFDVEEAVRRAKESLELTRRRQDLAVLQKENALALAELNRSNVFEQPDADARRQSELTVAYAQLRFEQGEKEYQAEAELHERGYASEASLKQKRLNVASRKADLAKERDLQGLVLAGATAESKRQEDLKVEQAKMDLETSRFNRTAQLAMEQADLELAQIRLENFKANMDRKQNERDNTDVKTLVRGRVAFVDVFKGSSSNLSPIQIGETRNRGQDLCKIADTSMLRVQVRVNETDLPRIRQGQEAQIQLPAFPERTFHGKVSEIAHMARDKNVALSRSALLRAGEAFVNVVEVTLDFEELTEADRAAMRLGFTATVRFEVGADDSVLVVPWTAVGFDAKREPYVEVQGALAGGRRRPVKLGRSDEFHVEVLEGLDESARILDRGDSPEAAR